MSAPCQFRVRPPQVAWFLLAIGAAFRIGLYGWPALITMPLIVGGSIALIGLAIMLWAWSQFKRSQTPVCHRHQPVKLVTTGAFHYTRNPMYLGLLLMLLGVGIAVGRWPMLLPPVVFFLVMTFVFIPCEERWMAQIFGDDYTRYRARARRWV